MGVIPISGVCVGCGLWINPGTGLLEVHRAPDSGMSCTDAGLKVEFPPSQTGSNTFDAATGQVKISSDDCNCLEPTGTGLYVKCPSSLVYGPPTMGYVGAGFPVGLNIGGGPSAEFSVANFGGPFAVTNPFPWLIEGFWEFRAYGGWVRANDGFDGYAYLSSRIDGLPTTWAAAAPPTHFRMDNRGSGRTVDYEPSNLVEKNYIAFAANQTYTFELRTTIKCTAGTGTWLDTANAGRDPLFEFYLHCTPTELSRCP